MDLASTIYLICFLVGIGFAVISAFLSGVFGNFHLGADHDVDVGGHSVDIGGHDVDVGGHDIDIGDHDIDLGDHGDSSNNGSDGHLSPVSPITIATFITSFGGIGLIMKEGLRAPLFLSLPVASGSGLVVAGIIFYLFYKIFQVTQASSEPTRESVLDIEAEVITPIPADGVGEISYVVKGSRFTAPARSEEKEPIVKRTMVRITKVVGSIFYVREIPDEKLRRLASAEKYQLQTEAEGKSLAIKAKADADASVIKAQGFAKADVTKAKGVAEAEAMSMKTGAWQTYNQAAITQVVMEKLPEIAQAISTPLAKTERIVIIGDGDSVGAARITDDIAKIIAQLPLMIESLSGLNLAKIVEQIPEMASVEKTPQKAEFAEERSVDMPEPEEKVE